MLKNSFFFLTFFFLLQSFSKCREEPVDPNVTPNPCETFEKNRPNIQLLSNVDTVYVDIENDTIFFDNRSEFNNWYAFTLKVTGNADSVKWKIGTDTRLWEGKTVRFTMETPDEEIDIIAYIKRPANTNCQAGDTGRDTIRKRFYTRYGTPNDMKWEGQYLGYLESNKADTFTVSVKYRQDDRRGYSNFFMDNLPKGNHGSYMGSVYDTGKGIPIITLGKYFFLTGWWGDFPELHYPRYTLGALKGDSISIFMSNKYTTNYWEDRFVGVRKK